MSRTNHRRPRKISVALSIEDSAGREHRIYKPVLGRIVEDVRGDFHIRGANGIRWRVS